MYCVQLNQVQSRYEMILVAQIYKTAFQVCKEIAHAL